jgi:hypothetical protein
MPLWLEIKWRRENGHDLFSTTQTRHIVMNSKKIFLRFGSILLFFSILIAIPFLLPALQSLDILNSGSEEESDLGSIPTPSIEITVAEVSTSSNLNLEPDQNPTAVVVEVLQEASPTAPPMPTTGAVSDNSVEVNVEDDPEMTTESKLDPNRSIFGYEFGSISEAHGLEQMYAAGAEWVRRDIWWANIEPQKGNYNWARMRTIEEEFLLAASRDMRVIVMVRGTPSWAQADYPYNRPCGRIRQSELGAFAAFMRALVERYSNAPYFVRYWEIWNEPDVDPVFIGSGNEWMGCWGDIDDPYYGGETYAEMLKVVYPEVKAANPEAQLLVGGLLLDCDPIHIPSYREECDASKFMEGILLGGGGPYFDGISFHAYDYNGDALGVFGNLNWDSYSDRTGPVLIAKANYLKGLLEAYDAPGKFLINTETAVLCHTGNRRTCETTKAIYTVQTYVAAYVVGLEANLWYFWQERDGGLLRSSLAILPAYETYTFANRQLTGSKYLKEITDYLPTVRTYAFEAEYIRLWVLWSVDGGTYEVALPENPTVVQDAFGESLSIQNRITVGPIPVYVKWFKSDLWKHLSME